MACGLIFAGCASEENSGYGTGSAPAAEQGEVTTDNTSEIPSPVGDTTRLKSMPRVEPGMTNEAVSTNQGAGKGAFEDQNLDGAPTGSPAGTGAQNPTVNTNSVGNAGSSVPQN